MKHKLLLFKALGVFLVSHYTLNAQNMKFERIYDETLAQASYIIANDKNEAIVIDPKRDIDTYLEYAKKNGLTIKYVTETHIHADYLSGAPELAKATQADLLLSNEGGPDWQYAFDHQPLKDQQIIQLGNVELKVIHTPGHTPESLTFLVKNTKDQTAPTKAITGDFIFVGDVGRPDLLEKAAGQKGSQFEGAYQLFTSLNQFIKLPKNTEIWPGHGAGSFCGKSLSNIPQSTLEQEMATSPAFQYLNDKDAFTKFILDGQPEPPKYFAVMKQWNKSVRPLLIEVPKIQNLSTVELENAIKNNVLVIDARKKEEVAKGFIPGSLHIEGGKSFATFVGSLVDYNNQIVLVGNEDQIENLQRKLIRIGMDNIYGYISDVKELNGLKTSNIITAKEVQQLMKVKNVQLVDVRTATEYASGHIKGFENITLNSLEKNVSKIQKDAPVIIHCQSGVRGAMAYSILEKLGYTNILNYSGSINDWSAKKLPLVK
ncbi:MBL fold metallo-hydrolase [Flavobacterium sp. I3-2]|uniref:MBL fold metallo-hydrolase n=1 Tax=Flavobacterium sp. I3-2 TaxID=2748319 RepID=UPI00210781DC|nr:MBL fold metallo-hydrolase [Flavobacterium sp. I3-2]